MISHPNFTKYTSNLVGGKQSHRVDESFLEGGINSFLARIVNRTYNPQQARRECLKFFYARACDQISFLLRDLPSESHGKSWAEKDINGYMQYAVDIIVDVVIRVATSPPPQRLPHQRKVIADAFEGETLIMRADAISETKKLKVFSHEVGAPGYALFTVKAGRGRQAPDGVVSAIGCSAVNCTSSEMDHKFVKVQQMICGHTMCTACQPDAEFDRLCSLCIRQTEVMSIELFDQCYNNLQDVLTPDDVHKRRDDLQGILDDESSDDDTIPGDDDNDDDNITTTLPSEVIETSIQQLEKRAKERLATEITAYIRRAQNSHTTVVASSDGEHFTIETPLTPPAATQPQEERDQNNDNNVRRLKCTFPGCKKTYLLAGFLRRHMLEAHKQ